MSVVDPREDKNWNRKEDLETWQDSDIPKHRQGSCLTGREHWLAGVLVSLQGSGTWACASGRSWSNRSPCQSTDGLEMKREKKHLSPETVWKTLAKRVRKLPCTHQFIRTYFPYLPAVFFPVTWSIADAAEAAPVSFPTARVLLPAQRQPPTRRLNRLPSPAWQGATFLLRFRAMIPFTKRC